jgi:hypothetical protein
MKAQCAKQSDTLVTRIGTVERNITDSISRVTTRLSVCEDAVGRVKAQCAKQSDTLVSRICAIEQNVRLLGDEFEWKISESLSPVVDRLSVCETDLQRLKLTLLPPVPPVSPSKSLTEVEFPFQKDRSKDGIISYLTQKHGDNIQNEGILTITSKSVYDDHPSNALWNLADLNGDLYFFSRNEPGQWVCWDFHKMRVSPTHYTISGSAMKSWVVESSPDGGVWTEIDRKTDNQDFKGGWETVSFAVSNSAECRFIWMTQTGQRHIRNDDYLVISAFEFFGTLLE